LFTGLSYPHMAPPLDWLMVQLLFYDEIKTIVPASEISDLPITHRRFYDSVGQAVSFIQPENESIWASEEETKRLIKGFEQIRRVTTFNHDKLSVVIDKKTYCQRIKDCAFLHATKTSPAICDALIDLGLMPRVPEEIAVFFVGKEQWLVMEENSADLLMGHLSNAVCKRYGYYPITYKGMPFILNSLNDIQASFVPDSQTMLASAIINLEFPFELSQLSQTKYNEIRKAYADIRIPFHELVNQLSEINRLNQIGDPKELEERIHNVVTEFDLEYMKFKNSALLKNIQEWTPLTAAGLLTIIASTTLTFPWNLIIAGGSISISVIDKIAAGKKDASNTNLLNRLTSLEKDIIHKADIQFLL